MPRRTKPPGYEKWTWAEINAGRKFSKAEKRWNRFGKSMGWESGPGGSPVVPSHAQPIVAIIAVLIVAMGIVAPHGVANTKGEAGAIGSLILLAIIPLGLLLVAVGQGGEREPRKGPATAPWKPPPTIVPPQPPRIPVFRPWLTRQYWTVRWLISMTWVGMMPEWSQPIVWGVVIGIPVATILAFALRYAS